MPEPAIDLTRGLELWVDLAPRYWDAQRNQIMDKSGYGRHPEASGGPTVGVEGPDDFEAVSFDGTDDEFNFAGHQLFTQNHTFFAIVKVDDKNVGDVQRIVESAVGVDTRLSEYQGNWRLGLVDSGSNETAATISAEADVWTRLVGTYDGTNIRLFDGTTTAIATWSSSMRDRSGDNNSIGYDGTNDGRYLQGDIAVVGAWSRVLTWAEVQHLSRVTAPRRAIA